MTGSALRRRAAWAHPRPCGEHRTHLAIHPKIQGSSPPVRGARRRGHRESRCGGLIPARAGSTVPFKIGGLLPRAHPRPCGEHVGAKDLDGGLVGSSPPVRGAPGWSCAPGRRPGLIPARAGSTLLLLLWRMHRGAHPRPCGEHTQGATAANRYEGSSPPVRGAPAVITTPTARCGLIPARAGSTYRLAAIRFPTRAHPRPCGEHS